MPRRLNEMMRQAYNAIRQRYWSWCAARHRRATHRILSPHDPFRAVCRHADVAVSRGEPRPLVMVDGGAHDGLMARRFVDRLRPREVAVHAFEPNPDLQEELRRNLAGVPGGIHRAALAQQSGSIDLYFNNSPMTASALPATDLTARYFADVNESIGAAPVPAVSLDDWFARSGMPAVDILKLDLQGYELQALRGAERVLAAGVGLLYVEVNFARFYAGGALYGEIEQFLRRRGYQLLNLYHLCTHEPDGQVGSADAIFVPEQASQRRVMRTAA